VTSPELADVSPSARVGSYAGPATRLAAWIVDLFVSHAMFAGLTLTISVMVAVFTGKTLHVQVPGDVGVPADLIWLYLYFFVSWATVGKTPGMTLVGLKVVRRDETKLSPARAAVRTLVFPLSFILLGLGFIGVVIGKERRALQDVAADSIVVYD
jgi:uncharacterized RDD family membrane protein YckC